MLPPRDRRAHSRGAPAQTPHSLSRRRVPPREDYDRGASAPEHPCLTRFLQQSARSNGCHKLFPPLPPPVESPHLPQRRDQHSPVFLLPCPQAAFDDFADSLARVP